MKIKHIILIILSLSLFALTACSSSTPAPLGEVMAGQDQVQNQTSEATPNVITDTSDTQDVIADTSDTQDAIVDTSDTQGNAANAPQENSGNAYGKNGNQGQSQNTTEIMPVPEIDYADVELIDCLICDIDMSDYTGELNEDEVKGLLLALNDEYHAWAVYDQVLQDFGDVNPFTNIIGAEAMHISALEGVMNTYGVPIPENLWIGNAPSFDSTQEACAVGVEAEIANAALYDAINSSTDREDILTVYNSLQQASLQQHLPAFENCASGQGGGQSRGGHGNGGGGNHGQSHS